MRGNRLLAAAVAMVIPAISFAHDMRLRSAAECSSVDLRGPKLGPVYQQADRNWCYAFTTADLISHKAGKRVAAADVAMGANGAWSWAFQQMLGHDEMERGAPLKLVLERAIDRPLCPEELMPLDKDRGKHRSSAWKELSGLKNAINDYNASPEWERVRGMDRVCNGLDKVSEILPMIDFRTLMEIVEESNEQELLTEVTRELSRRCEGKRVDFGVRSRVRKDRAAGAATGQRLFFQIDRLLDSKNVVAIQYWQDFLTAADPYSVQALDSVGDHASTVVGRRFSEKSGRCEYLVRNSWGTDCSQYNQGKEKLDCDAGNVWVPEDLLNRHLRQIVYLEDPLVSFSK